MDDKKGKGSRQKATGAEKKLKDQEKRTGLNQKPVGADKQAEESDKRVAASKQTPDVPSKVRPIPEKNRSSSEKKGSIPQQMRPVAGKVLPSGKKRSAASQAKPTGSQTVRVRSENQPVDLERTLVDSKKKLADLKKKATGSEEKITVSKQKLNDLQEKLETPKQKASAPKIKRTVPQKVGTIPKKSRAGSESTPAALQKENFVAQKKPTDLQTVRVASESKQTKPNVVNPVPPKKKTDPDTQRIESNEALSGAGGNFSLDSDEEVLVSTQQLIASKEEETGLASDQKVDLSRPKKQKLRHIKRPEFAVPIAFLFLNALVFLPAKSSVLFLAILFFAAVALGEFYDILKHVGFSVSRKLGIVNGVIFLSATWTLGLLELPVCSQTSLLVLFIFSIFFRVMAFEDSKIATQSIMASLFGFIYVSFLGSFLVRILLMGSLDRPAWILLYLICVVKGGEIVSHFVEKLQGKDAGKRLWGLLGRHSRLGVFANITAAMMISIVWWIFTLGVIGNQDLSFTHIVILGLLLPTVAIAGDVVETALRDSIPYSEEPAPIIHGVSGVLDLVDSLLFAAPCLYIYLSFFTN